MQYKRIVVLAARDQDTLERSGADVESDYFTNLVDAKRYARYVLTEQYQRVCEASERIGYAQVLVNGNCVYDVFAS